MLGRPRARAASTRGHLAQYDAIAEAYRDSKQLPFRKAIERYTLFEALGDVRGATVLDLACGGGFYTRLLRRAGAARVTGVDVSAEMIRLAEREEARDPLGCAYLHRDVADLDPEPGAADLVVAMYLLHYAGTRARLLRFLRVCHDALRPGGRIVGFNDNVMHPPRGTVSWRKYGIEKTGPAEPREGDPIRYRFTNPDGRQFEFHNFFLKPRDLPRRLPGGRVPRLPLARRRPGPRRAAQPLLGRLPRRPAGGRLRGDEAAGRRGYLTKATVLG